MIFFCEGIRRINYIWSVNSGSILSGSKCVQWRISVKSNDVIGVCVNTAGVVTFIGPNFEHKKFAIKLNRKWRVGVMILDSGVEVQILK